MRIIRLIQPSFRYF